MVEKAYKEKKKWFQILAPMEFNNVDIGESLCFSPESMMGKTVVSNLAALTNDMGKQGINIIFKVNQIEKEKGLTEFVGYKLTSSFIHRLARREKDKLEESFVLVTKDNINAKLKFILLTKNRTYKSVLAKLRKEIADLSKDIAVKNDFKAIVNAVISGNLQRTLKKELNKIYPIAMIEVRVLERVTNSNK